MSVAAEERRRESRRDWPRLGPALIALAVAGAWLLLFRPILPYLALVFTREDFRTNQIVLLGALGFLIWRARGARLGVDLRPRLAPLPLAVALGGAVLYLLAARFLDVNAVSAAIFGGATYGLLGLYLPTDRWRQGLPTAFLLVLALPFGDHLQTFVGYPARLLTAALVRDVFALAGIGGLGVETILVLENGVAQVDSPCSGVRSLWTGLLLLLAATWVERRPLGRRFLGAAVALVALLLAANALRVGALIFLAGVVGGEGRTIAEMVHVPLGALGFAAAGAAAIWIVRLGPTHAGGTAPDDRPRPRWLGLILVATALGLSPLSAPPPTVPSSAPIEWRLPADIEALALPLDPESVDWLRRDGAESAERWRFRSGELGGQLLLVASAGWRAQHLPERCFEVQGLSVDESRAHLAASDFPLRLVALGARQGERRTAAYWFSSPTRTTDDWATRFWADLAGPRERWALVTILFDGAVDPRSAEATSLFLALRDGARDSLIDAQIEAQIEAQIR